MPTPMNARDNVSIIARKFQVLTLVLIAVLILGNSFGYSNEYLKENVKTYQLVISNAFPNAAQEEKGIYLAQPVDFAFDHEGNIWIVDYKLHKALKFTNDGIFIDSYGKMGQGPNEYQRPSGIKIENENIVIRDQGNARIAIMDMKGIINKSFKIFKSFAWYAVNNNLIYSDANDDKVLIQVMDFNGSILNTFGNKKIFVNNNRAVNDINICIGNHNEIIVNWRYFGDLSIYNEKGEMIREIKIKDADLLRQIKKNLDVVNKAGDPRKVELYEIISGIYSVDNKIYILSQLPEIMCIYELNYEGEIISIYAMENTTRMVSGLLIKGGGREKRIFTIEQYPEAKVLELQVK